MANLKGLKALAQLLPDSQANDDTSDNLDVLSTDPEEIPMMYRAQIGGRCSLHFAGKNNKDLDDWLEEWANAKLQQSPRYQHQEPQLGWDGNVYRIKVEFPWRLFSNCGQDSIARPVIGKNGIPVIPGSSIKGLFRRVCDNEQLAKYCGDDRDLNPSSLGFRFHGAYPLGNWSERIGDVVHPQQPRQVEHTKGGSAFALISLYQPYMVFEFSASDHAQVDWEEVHQLLQAALERGFGGKTSTGYGMSGHIPGQSPTYPQAAYMVRLTGIGIKSTLRTGEFEFRPNLFKASLRAHAKRLLGGVCSNSKTVETKVGSFFGGTESPGNIQLLWQERSNSSNDVANYDVSGVLRLCGSQHESSFVYQILQFAYVMGGFGKSWRRVWHRTFHPSYQKLDIGCHWQSQDIISTVRSSEDLQNFLDQLHQSCRSLMRSNGRATQWKEAWHPNRVAVFSHLTDTSSVVSLFHNEIFKTTPAIGGRKTNDKRPTSVSFVWHRMLPISSQENQYLEIVTIFYSDLRAWDHTDEGRQLNTFIQALENTGLALTWGNLPLS